MMWLKIIVLHIIIFIVFHHIAKYLWKESLNSNNQQFHNINKAKQNPPLH